jgi:DNA mismatch repair protein MutS2
MNEHTLEILEFEKIRDELRALCVSPQGSQLIGGQEFETEASRVKDALDLAVSFRAALESGTPLPGLDFPDISALFSVLGKEGLQLDGEDLAALGRNILSSLKLKRFVLKCAAEPRISDMARGIPDLGEVSRRIFHVIDHEGNLREKRIPELAAIRDRIRRFREEAERTARGMLEADSSRSYWQSNLPTQRDGRLVLPLKAQFKGRVKGIVHELSASGSTLFIEPLDIVEKNNAIIQEENLYRLEMRRILRGLTAEVSARRRELADMSDTVARLDALLARARFAILRTCRPAELSPGTISLLDARHPLLGGSCVPITIAAGGEYRILIITGPNTGGKTVSLKTVGVLALLHQFGMEIPAAEGSTLPVFQDIFADIGDEQSIEQSLSTFSAHVTNLAGIVAHAEGRSLVLLDELGAGTDPEEGVALAMALMDRFLEAGSIVLATTHHGILKNYGYTRPGVQNASMGFDKETLSPNFRILMGVPGESHALEIARRRGIPEAVVSNAAAYLADERTEISHLVKNLSERHQKLAQAEEDHRAREFDLREKRRRTDLKELALRQKELELRRLGLKELRDFLSSIRKEWEDLKEKVDAAGVSGQSSAGPLFGRLQERIEREEARIAEQRESLLQEQEEFEIRPDMEVVIRNTGRRGKVLRKDKGKRWIVETETMRLSLLPGEMRPLAEAEERPPLFSVSYSTADAGELPVLELNLRGLRMEEALRRLEKQIDGALIHGLRQFSVIHGKGEGILQRAIHEYLKKATVVEDYYFSAPDEGGFGKTLVVLKG